MSASLVQSYVEHTTYISQEVRGRIALGERQYGTTTRSLTGEVVDISFVGLI